MTALGFRPHLAHEGISNIAGGAVAATRILGQSCRVTCQTISIS